LAPEWAINRLLFRKRTDGRYQVDVLRSEVVEFARPVSDGAAVRAGRLFYDVTYFDEDGHKVEKSKEFRRWADRILQFMKRHTTRDATLDAYVGTGAARVRESGGVEFKPM